MKFPTQYDHEKTIPSEVGSGVVTEYSPVYDDKGVWHLEESGKRDLYSEIQSHKDSCDIHVILKRYANGEVDVISKVQGIFEDISDMPTNFAAMLNIVTKAEESYNKLPVEFKQKFNNSFTEFLASAGTEEYFEKLGYRIDKGVPYTSSFESEVSSNEKSE